MWLLSLSGLNDTPVTPSWPGVLWLCVCIFRVSVYSVCDLIWEVPDCLDVLFLLVSVMSSVSRGDVPFLPLSLCEWSNQMREKTGGLTPKLELKPRTGVSRREAVLHAAEAAWGWGSLLGPARCRQADHLVSSQDAWRMFNSCP